MKFHQDAADAVGIADWLVWPHNRQGLREVERAVRCATVSAGVRPPRVLASVDDDPWATAQVVFGGEPGRLSLDAFLERTHTDSILVLRGETIVLERYLHGNTPSTRHSAMSVSKSFCGMLAGTLVGDGVLDTSARVEAFVPELADGAFRGTTVRQLLDMTATPRFDMTYTDPETEVQAGDRCAGWRRRRDGDPSGTRAFLTALRGNGRHGSAFQYCSASTDVLAWVLERAAGVEYRRLLAQRIWSLMGAEADALITVDAHGTPYACAGMAMRLRDLARFGRLILDGGAGVIPAGWIEQTAVGGKFNTLRADGLIAGTYRNQWWIPEPQPGVMYAAGIFGQYLWLDAHNDVVVAKFSSEPEPLAHSHEHVQALASLARHAADCARSAVSTRET